MLQTLQENVEELLRLAACADALGRCPRKILISTEREQIYDFGEESIFL